MGDEKIAGAQTIQRGKIMRLGEAELEDFKLRELRQKVDTLCEEIKTRISLSEFFKKEKELKTWCLRRYPDKAELYELIYRSRFKRLWEQFKNTKIEFPGDSLEEKS